MSDALHYGPDDLDHLMDVGMLDAAEARQLFGHERNDIDNPPAADASIDRPTGRALAAAVLNGDIDPETIEVTEPSEENIEKIICGKCNRPGCPGCKYE